jgi:alanine-glyoxylate transaminase/serine-glyoxylate transaminase/serine-pyruvate transaminase
MSNTYTDLSPSPRILLGPGPSLADPRVLRAMATPLIGHLDPEFIAIMNDVQELLRYVFQTENKMTIPVSGTGSAGMEAAFCNFVEPGDHVLVCINGLFGQRMADVASRYGATVTTIERAWGEVFTPSEIETALKQKPAKIVAIVHAETSTGALQPMDRLGDIAHRHGAMLLLDCVTSLGGVAVQIDKWGVDIAYSGTQKCLSCPPGLAPLTISERAREILRGRKTKVANWYLDLSMLESYWGNARTYHHTAPISMNYALREALRLVYEEGLAARFARHRANAELLWAGLEAQGFEMHVPLAHRLPSLSTPRIPEGLDEADIRRQLLEKYNIEISGGFGPLKGQVWRIGLMGYSSRREYVALLLTALREIMD